MTVFTAAYDLEWKPSGSWVAVADNSVVSISGSLETAQADGGVGFGTTAVTRATVQVLRTAVAGLTLARMPSLSRPGKIVCVGRNYREHAKELGNEVPAEPLLFLLGLAGVANALSKAPDEGDNAMLGLFAALALLLALLSRLPVPTGSI